MKTGNKILGKNEEKKRKRSNLLSLFLQVQISVETICLINKNGGWYGNICKALIQEEIRCGAIGATDKCFGRGTGRLEPSDL